MKKGRVYTSAVGRERGGRLWSYWNITGEAVEWKGAGGGPHMLGSWIYVFFSSYNVILVLRASFGDVYTKSRK